MTLIITNARELFFTSSEEYHTWRAAHREKARNKALTAEDCAAFALMTGRDLYKAFSASKKLEANGQPPYSALARALDNLSWTGRTGSLGNPATPTERMRVRLYRAVHNSPGGRHLIAMGRGSQADLEPKGGA